MHSQPTVPKKVAINVKYKNLNRFINLLLWIIIIVYLLGIVAYGERFNFWNYSFSQIGRYKTPGGYSNTISILIFATGMLICSWQCIRISKILPGQLNQYLFRVCAAGYILNIFPCDLYITIHSIGGALIVGSLWLFTVLQIGQISQSGNKTRAFLYHLLLQGTVLPYAVLYAIKSPSQKAVQKFAFLGLILSVKVVITVQARIENSCSEIEDHETIVA